MDYTVGTRTTVAASAAALIGGVATSIHGIIHDDIARSFGGTCLATPAAIIFGLILVRRWILDSRDERRRLTEATRKADEERARFFALEAAATMEQARYRQDIAAEQASITARLNAEREAMEAEFEEARGNLSAEAMNIAMSWIRGGRFTPPQSARGNLIQFPQQHPEPQPATAQQRERSREHGGVAP